MISHGYAFLDYHNNWGRRIAYHEPRLLGRGRGGSVNRSTLAHAPRQMLTSLGERGGLCTSPLLRRGR
eukprot:scaffold87940_cov32-Tisochrysis_lutea.AAC.1